MTSDMPSDFWAGWIVVLTVVSFVGLGWMIFSIYFSGNVEKGDEVSPVWDGDLREGFRPAPMWWFWLILAAMVFSVLYLMLYPGLGSFQGALKWSQGGRLEQSESAYHSEFGGVRTLIAEGNLATLGKDPSLMQSAERVFARNCAACHGYDAAGQAAMFPNLVDEDWQWGGSPAQIEQSIVAGRNAVMVGWLQVLGGEEGVKRMADYVRVIGTDAANGHPSHGQYQMFCAACHGAQGNGNPILGAPNLADDIWLYGDSDAALYETLANGRQGQMPAYRSRLDDTQVKLLIAWLLKPDPAQ
ncbi:MAG: cytochrome-c oxidase, cbb3-type subunit III [Woeseia sp.]|nr:cytochrome-c oxidase, cbb3-type subunit III [Woeseia sp.]MBT8096589.1 cytochrome-c oxidase, cbb3-type subunit III [Woeseia sp.]NNE62325.1 cytochrome-c oxidase, cbb3-type subunit III [Woeseia sp.]NNL55816.1 cytochrome-c oxidase, cbb3-type subunit III [Woeseia sp.]